MNENRASGKPLRVLLLEDNEMDAELVEQQLQRAGHKLELTVAENEAALRKALGKKFDVVLSDYRMRDWTGMDSFELLRQHGHTEPFLLISGSLGEELAIDCLKRGVSDFLLKNRMERLPLALKRALDESAEHQRRLQAEAEAITAREQLEERVKQRTAELLAANTALRQEVEQRRLAEVALRQSEQSFRLLTEASPGFVWTATPEGAIDYINQRWYEYTGLWVEQTEGNGWESAVHPDDLEQTRRRWEKSLHSGETYENECRLRSGDGSYCWYLNRAVPMLGPGGEIVKWFGSSTDINDQKLAEQAKEQLAAMREDLVANVSHALRTPLASLRGFSELMLHRDFPPERQREFIQTIYQESSRLTALIGEFLKLQRMESGRQVFNFEPLDLVDLIRERAAFFGAADQRHQIRLEVPVNLSKVKGDPEAIREVLNNLISNALKYSPKGGDIVIGVRSEANEVVLWVADKGIGIPAHAMPHLFERFYRVESVESREISGTGLGLAMVKQIVELHRGRVWAESIYGEGSTFFVALNPLLAQTAEPVVPAPEGERSRTSQLLIVEDDRAFAALLVEHFESIGISVTHTAFAEEALEWCRVSAPKVILLDMHLAGAMDGWDLLLLLKNHEILEDIRIFVMVGSDPNVHGLALGGADYVSKLGTEDSLWNAVQRQLPKLEGSRVLVADDSILFRTRIAKLLESRGAQVRSAVNGTEALEFINQQMPDLLILDMLMPGLDGFEVLRRLRSDRRAVNLRTIVMTGKELSIKEKEYLDRKMASMVGKSEADLDYFSHMVTQALGLPATQAASAN
jgi:PAS domain S-box-containing protein